MKLPAPLVRSLVLAAALSLGLGVVAHAQRDEAAFFATPDQIALHAHGWTVDYRFRRVQMQQEPGSELPRMVHDGVTRMRFDGGGIWTDEAYFELLDQEGYRAVPRHTRTFHSLTSGLYARTFGVAGGPTETAIIEPWSGLPTIAYYGLGFVDGAAVLRRGTPAGHESLGDGRERASFSTPEGKRWSVEYSTAGAGAMLRVVGRPSDDSWTDVIEFEGHVPGPPGLPMRPTRICSTRVDAHGVVAYVSVWQAIERLDPAQPADFEVAPQTAVADFRAEGLPSATRATDRRLSLDELTTWAGALADPYSDAPVELGRDEIENRIEAHVQAQRRRQNRVLGGWAAAFIGLVLGSAALLRRRTS